MSRNEFGTVVDGEVLGQTSNIDLEAVSARLSANIELLKKAYVICEGGLFKLVIPGEVAEDEKLTVLVLKESELKNARGLDVKLSKAVDEVGYEGEAKVAVVTVAGKLMSEAAAKEKKTAEMQLATSPFPQGPGKLRTNVGLIEKLQMNTVRPFTIFTQRGLESAVTISNEGWESLALEAQAQNDYRRMDYLAKQAAEAIETLGDFGIDTTWQELYDNSMTAEMGAGNYPSLKTRQGLELFLKKVYMPSLALLLHAAETASVMGDHQAIMVTAELKQEMEVMLAEQAASAAEKVQPARARSEMARVKAEAGVATVLKQNSDVLMVAKRIRARLAAATVASPFLHATGEILEAGSEAAPAVLKGFAEYLNRWLEQTGADKKLVGSTTGGLAVGIVATFWLGPWMLIAAPALAAAGYMAVKGFTSREEEE